MAICNHLAPNGEKSLLYAALEQEYGEDKAHNYWEAIRTLQFTNAHPWESLDANGEPETTWVKEKLKLPGMLVPSDGTTPHEEIVRAKKKISMEPDRFKGLTNRESEGSIQEKIKAVYKDAMSNPETDYVFDYPKISSRKRYNSGYTNQEMANIIDAIGDAPDNVIFPDHMKGALLNSSRRINEATRTDTPVELLNRNEKEITNDLNRILLPKLGPNGEPLGYFTTSQHQDIVNSLLHNVQSLLKEDPRYGANAIIATFSDIADIKDDVEVYGFMHQSRVRLAGNVIDAMQKYGYLVNEKSRGKILQAVEALVQMKGFEAKINEAPVPEHVEDTQVMDENNTTISEALGKGLADWGEVSFQHDPKDTASGRMKMFLATQIDMDRGVYDVKADGVYIDPKRTDYAKIAEETNRRGVWSTDETTAEKIAAKLPPIVPTRTFLGSYKLVDFESLHAKILETLAGQTTHTLENYVQVLKESNQPNMINIADAITSAPKEIQNEFAKIAAMQYDDFILGMHSKITDEASLADEYNLSVMHTNAGSQRQTIIKGWQQSQKQADITVINAAGERTIDTERSTRWVKNLGIINKEGHLDDIGSAHRKRSKDYVQGILKLSGINLTDQMMDDLAQNMNFYTKGTTFAGDWGRQFSITQSGKPNGMFSAFVMKMAGEYDKEDMDIWNDNAENSSKLQLNNPLYTENTTMQILARVAAKFTDDLHSGSSLSVERKQIWNFSMHSNFSRQFQQLGADTFNEFAARYAKVDIARDNALLRTLTNQPKYRDRVRLAYLDGLKSAWQKRGVTRAGMSDREQALMSMLLFQNRGGGFKDHPEVHYMSLTHADKTTTPIAFNMPRYEMGNSSTLPDNIVGTNDAMFYKIFRGEWSRILNGAKKNYNDARYDKGKDLFYQIPEFNYDYMKRAVGEGKLTQKDFETIWLKGERTLTPGIKGEEIAVINKVLHNKIGDLIDSTKKLWTEQGLLSEDSHMFDKKYTDRILRNEGFHMNSGEYIKGNMRMDKKEAIAALGHAAAKDYALNYFLHNTTMAQLFFGDPAIAHKGGGNDFERVKATMDEYGKRLAKDIAPGLEPLFEKNDRTFRSVTMKDMIVDEKYLDFMGKAYKKVNATDAQEFTTVQEHLKVAYAQGLVPSKVYNDMMKIVTDNKGKFYEFTNPEHLAVILQPMKPVFSALRTARDGAMLSDYVKTSSYPLYPPATAGTHLDLLRMRAESNGIDRMVFESGKKLGAPTNPVQYFGEDGSFQAPSKESENLGIQVLDRSGFRIQQDVPYDETKTEIKVVSQMNKLIHEGIADIKDFRIPGHEGTMTGDQVRALKETIRKNMINDQYNHFIKNWNLQNDGIIPDKSVIYDMLANAADPAQFTPNEINSLRMRDANGNPHIALMYNTATDKFEAQLMSMIKDVSQIKMTGKSYVQASPAGWKFSEDADLSNSKIVWASGYDGKGLKTMRKGEKEGDPSLPAQVLVPLSFLTKEGTSFDISKYTIERNGRKEVDESKIPPELLQLIGARIPNQGHNSMSAMEVVGFLPANMGDTVVVPAGFTAQMGADFDVDKLYTYRRPYYQEKESGNFRADKFNFAKHQSDYFDLHWGVLTHPDMLSKVLQPLDREDLKDQNKLLAPDTRAAFFDVSSQLADFQRGKDAKTLVGMTSLSVTFNSLIQNKNLYYGKKIVVDVDGTPTPKIIRDYIRVRDEHTGKELKLTNLSGNGKSNYTKEDGGPTGPDTVRTKGDNHQTGQNAAVDNAKERTLDNINLTPHTYPAYDALNQMETEDGKAVNVKYGSRLLTQPIIKEFASEMKKGNDSLSDAYNADLKNTVFAKLFKKYASAENAPEPIVFDPQLLLKAQKMDPNSDEFKQHQIAALDLFMRLDEIGTRKSEVQKLFNQDTNGAGPNILSALDTSEKMNKAYLDSGVIMDVMSIYQQAGKITEAGYTADTSTELAAKVLTQLLPYDKLKPIIDGITKLGGKTSMSIPDQRAVLRAIKSFAFATGNHWGKSAHAERVRLLYNHGDLQSLAKRVLDAKESYGKGNYLLERLDPQFGDTKHAADHLKYNNGSGERGDEANNDKAWIELLTDGNPEHRQLGEDLIRYAFLTGGIQDNNSFVRFVPNSYIAGTPFGDMLKNREATLQGSNAAKMDDRALNMPGLIAQFIQHNPERAFVITREHFPDLDADQNYPEAFRLNSDKNELHKQFIDDDGMQRQFVSYKSTSEGKWILYQRFQTPFGEMFYNRIDTLGNTFTDEYNGQVPTAVRSIFSENRALSDGIASIDSLADLASWQAVKNGIPGDGYHPFDQIGLKEGGSKEINNALGTIIKSKGLPEYLRTVAEIYKTTTIPLAEFDAKKIYGDHIFDRQIQFTNDEVEAGASYSNGRIEMSRVMPRNATEAAQTLLHELGHQRTQDIVRATGYDPRWDAKMKSTMTPDEVKQLEARQAKFRADHPEVMEHIKVLDLLRYQAFNRWRNIVGEDEFRKAEENVASTKNLTENGRMHYALSSMHEFITHVMTDKGTQKFLNDMPHKQGSVLDKVWDLFTNMIAAISKYLGRPIREGSQLHEAVLRVMKLETANESADVNITKGIVEGRPGRADTEAYAKGIQDVAKNVYGTDVKITSDPLGHDLHFPLGQRKSNNPVISNVSDALDKQLKAARLDIDKGTEADQSQARIRYNEIRDDRANVLREQNMATITQVATKQLNWAETVLKSDSKDPVTTNAALRIADTWDDMNEMMYGKELTTANLDPTVAVISDRAAAIRQQLVNDNCIQIVTDIFNQRGIPFTQDALSKKNLTDVGVIESNAITLSRVKSVFLSSTGVLMKGAANNRDEDVQRVHDKLVDIKERMRKAGLSPDQLVQEDDWALTDRYSGKWNAHLNELARKRDSNISSINNTEFNMDNGSADKVRKGRKAEAWADYWNSIRKVGTFVDSRVMFDVKTGEKLTDEKATAAYEKLKTEVGSEDHAKELVEKAQDRYKKYIRERDVAQAHIESETTLTDEEMAGKSDKEQQELRNSKKADALEEWTAHNSPHEFLNRMKGGGRLKYVNDGDRWVIMAPKVDQKSFYDKRYTELMKNPVHAKIHADYKEILQSLVNELPPGVKEALPENFLPIVSHDTINGLAGMLNKIKDFDNTLINSLTASEQAEWARIRPDEIPIMYTSATKRTEDIADRSKDVIRIAEIFAHMALTYKHMSPVLDQVLVAERIVKEANRRRANGDDEGPMLENAMKMIQYNKDHLIFNKPRELEGKIERKIYTGDKRALDFKAEKEVKRLTEEKEAIQKEIDKRFEDDNYDTTDLDKKLETIDLKLTEYEKKARYIYTSKVADVLMSVNQFKALSWNPFSAGANFMFALISNHVYAAGKTDFDSSHLWRAQGIMRNAMLNYYTFGAAENPGSAKIRAMMERAQVMTELTGMEHQATHDKSHLKEALSPFNWQKSGDYFAKGSMMIAMMLKKTIDVTDVNSGETRNINIWDAFDNKGQWDESKYVPNEKWYSSDVRQQTDWNQFRDKMRGVSTIVFGNQDKNSPLMAKRSTLWRLVGQFRMSWFPEGVMTRFGSQRFDPLLQRDVKGRYRTYGTLGIFSSFAIMGRSLLDQLPLLHVDRFKGLTDRNNNEISDVDKENMRRNFSGLAWTVTVTAAIMGIRASLQSGQGKKADDDAQRAKFIMNMLTRASQDLTQYSSPQVFDTVTGNLIPVTSVITDSWKAMKAAGHYMFGDTHKDKHAFNTMAKKITKATPIVNNINKVEYMFNKDIDAIQR